MDRSLAAALLDALPMPALLIGPTERVLAANIAAGRLFGWDGAGRHYITALRQPVLLDAVEQVFRDGEVRQSRYLAQAGNRDATWRVQVAPVETGDGRAVLLAFEDITAVEEAGQIRRDFVANVSHELRTPLTALLGFVETLRGPAKDDPVARERFLGIMEREAGRMAQLVADLLSLSRVEEEERVRPMTSVDLRALAESVAAAFEPQAKTAGVRLVLTLAEAVPPVPGDPDQLRQVLNNLVENALKYGSRGGVVEIALTGPAPEPALRTEGLRLSVRDEGDGIPAHHIPRLTERFYRVDSHRSREVGGTGLGLAIVKHIVNRHRGRLRVESEEGVGTVFTLVLPVG
ncbi:sensor histidine kinase [Pseudoroseicyclus sp. CXY001]|uniref:sensor histidine kinase n=1 Tax=Pseudoroseicyclus sp. CXY001 TaxID=3242492 RepID=UPI00358DD30D